MYSEDYTYAPDFEIWPWWVDWAEAANEEMLSQGLISSAELETT